jgi:hypothetical protein
LGCRRHASEQKRTSCHTDAHFLRQVKGRAQAAQILVGRSAFLRIGGMAGVRFEERKEAVLF